MVRLSGASAFYGSKEDVAQLCTDILIGSCCWIFSHNHENFARSRKSVLVSPEKFSQEPLEPVSYDRVADLLADRNPESSLYVDGVARGLRDCRGSCPFADQHSEAARRPSQTLPVDAIKILFFPNSLLRRKGFSAHIRHEDRWRTGRHGYANDVIPSISSFPWPFFWSKPDGRPWSPSGSETRVFSFS